METTAPERKMVTLAEYQNAARHNSGGRRIVEERAHYLAQDWAAFWRAGYSVGNSGIIRRGDAMQASLAVDRMAPGDVLVCRLSPAWTVERAAHEIAKAINRENFAADSGE